jgi:acyl dehydratase
MADWTFPVEASHIMMFARAIGDPNPVYADAEAAGDSEAGGIIAPPTFIQASAQFDPNYGLRPKFGQPWHGSGREPTGVVRQQSAAGGGGSQAGSRGVGLHAEQHYEYHRPLRPGDVLTSTSIPGNTWEREGRSGHLRFSENIIEWRDEAGELVVTARSVAVQTSGPRPSGNEEDKN